MQAKPLARHGGLTEREAAAALEKHGPNRLPEKKKASVFVVFARQLKDVMILLLGISALASFAVFFVQGAQTGWDFSSGALTATLIEPFIILAVIAMYVLLGGIQELQSLKAVSGLKALSVANATVVRGGKTVRIDAESLVPGDLMLLEAGDRINADAVLLEAFNLACVEAVLTGESASVAKSANAQSAPGAGLAEQANKVFSGCTVTSGSAQCRVVATGGATQLGAIAGLIAAQKAFMTPLQLKLNRLGRIFGYCGLALFAIVFLIQILILGINNVASTWNVALATSISLAVAAIPEGLGAFTTIILSLGIKRMAKQNALIKKVASVETLGSTSVICTDKTGTLTLNQMTLTGVWDYGKGGEFDLSLPDGRLDAMLTQFILCSDSQAKNDAEQAAAIGDPTELAIANYAQSIGMSGKKIAAAHPRVFAVPFDSERKLMTSVNAFGGETIAIVKGAPDVLVRRCGNVDAAAVTSKIDAWAAKSYRVLGLAVKKLGRHADLSDAGALETDLAFVGLFAMYDPPRPEAKAAIEECAGAGIKTVMITGDNLNSAKAIAREIGILKADTEAISGEQLAAMTDEQLAGKVAEYSVYARTTPADKLRIVKAWQANDQVVAMTGDGVNDAPALKAADIGCAIGVAGTDVTKEAADMIIMDDNFKTIVAAVGNGRKVYQTIKLVIQNVLLSSVAEVIVMFLGVLIFKYAFASSLVRFDGTQWVDSLDLHIFGPTQLLVINLVTDGFPAIALGVLGTREDLMGRRPYSKHESIFARRMGFNLLWQGCLFGLVTMVAFAIGTIYSRDHWFGNVMNGVDPATGSLIPGSNGLYAVGLNDLYAGSAAAFIALSVGISVHALSLMSHRSLFTCGLREYRIVYLAVATSVLAIVAVSLVPQIAFGLKMPVNLVADGGFLIGAGFALALVPWVVLELYKAVYNRIQKEVLATATPTTFQLVLRPQKRRRGAAREK